MIDIVFDILMAVMKLLPASPILLLVANIDKIEVLGMLNYFIPFDTCALMMDSWLVCVLIYYVVQNIDKILNKIPFL